MPAYKNKQALLFSPGWVLHKRLEKRQRNLRVLSFWAAIKFYRAGCRQNAFIQFY